MKMKRQHTKTYVKPKNERHKEGNLLLIATYIKKKKKPQKNNLILYLKELEKEEEN